MLLQDEQLAIYYAILEDDAEKLQKLLQTGIDVNAPLVSMNTVIALTTVYNYVHTYVCTYGNIYILVAYKGLLHVHIIHLLKVDIIII